MNSFRVARGLLALVVSAGAWAADINLTLPTLQNANHRYFHRLLYEALTADGHTVLLTPVDDIPQPRLMNYLEHNQLTMYWVLRTKERDQKFALVDHRLTQGLIGQRIFLVPKGEEQAYAKVKNLVDLQQLGKTAGLGQGWFDVKVWQENHLLVAENGGEWRRMYGMLAARNRGIDYMPRGASEIVAEAKDFPKLAIEPHLVLVYPRDLVFYLSKGNADLKPLVESALKRAEKSGLQKKLIDEYFGSSVSTLGLDNRVRIQLKDPPN